MSKAWSDAFDKVPHNHISHLPSLEIPEGDRNQRRFFKAYEELRFGIVGQIRPGKGIEWLVPLFLENPRIGRLTVVGEFFEEDLRDQLRCLNNYTGFINKFLSEVELLDYASGQDYLLMLYDEFWDMRMESAVLYVAARVNRPVIVYDRGWSGRMVREFGCGVLLNTQRERAEVSLMNIPKPMSPEYTELLKGMARFRSANLVSSLRDKVLSELLG